MTAKMEAHGSVLSIAQSIADATEEEDPDFGLICHLADDLRRLAKEGSHKTGFELLVVGCLK